MVTKIEKGVVIENSLVRTDFGIVNATQLSTGSKALLLALYAYPTVVSFREAGNNVVRYTVELSKQYDVSIFLDRRIIVSADVNVPICLNGEKVVTIHEYNLEVSRVWG